MIDKAILDEVLPVPELETLKEEKIAELKEEGFAITNFHSGGVFYTLLLIVLRIKIEFTELWKRVNHSYLRICVVCNQLITGDIHYGGVYVSCLLLPRYIPKQYAPVCAYSDCRRPTWGKCGGGRHLNIGWSETCGNDTNAFPSYQFRTFRYVERYYAYVLLCFVVFSCPAPSLRQRKVILLRRGGGDILYPFRPTPSARNGIPGITVAMLIPNH